MEHGNFSSTSINSLLAKKTVPELKQFAKSYEVSGTSKMKKSELIESMADVLQAPTHLEDILYLVDAESFSIFLRAAGKAGTLPIKQGSSNQCQLLSDFCYLGISQEGEDVVCFVPDEIKTSYAELESDGFRSRKERYDLLHNYATAAANLYGAISLYDFVEIFNQQNTKKTTLEELFPALVRHIACDSDYCFWKEYLVSSSFEENDFQDIKDLLMRIGNKPRHIPEKREFLRYAEWGYYERTEHTTRLEKYLTSQLSQPVLSTQQLVGEIRFACAVEANMLQIFNILEAYGVVVAKQQLDEIERLVQNLANNTRLWSNNGHTPNELSKYRLPTQHALSSQGNSPKKIGRNDPCPCGSGKKYKKCCGR